MKQMGLHPIGKDRLGPIGTTCLGHHLDRTPHDVDLRMAVESLHIPGNSLGHVGIVTIEKRDKLLPHARQPPVAGRRRAPLRLLGHRHFEVVALIAGFQLPAQRQRPVGRPVVDQHDMQRPVGLSHNRGKRPHQLLLPIIDGHHYGYACRFHRYKYNER